MGDFSGRGQTDWRYVSDVELKKFVDRYPRCRWISNGGCTDNGCIWHPDNHGKQSPSGTVYYHTNCFAVVQEAKTELESRIIPKRFSDYFPKQVAEHFFEADEETVRKMRNERACLFTVGRFQFYTSETHAHAAAAVLVKKFKNIYGRCEFTVKPVNWKVKDKYGNDISVVYRFVHGHDSFFTTFSMSKEEISERNKFRDEVHRLIEGNFISDAKVPIIPALSEFDVFSA